MCVSLDVVLELVFSRYYSFKTEVQDHLREAFLVFDEDRNGLELPEFKVMLTDLCKREDRGQAGEKEVVKLWKQLIYLGGQDEDESIFMQHDLFPVVCFQKAILPFIEKPAAAVETEADEPGGERNGP